MHLVEPAGAGAGYEVQLHGPGPRGRGHLDEARCGVNLPGGSDRGEEVGLG